MQLILSKTNFNQILFQNLINTSFLLWVEDAFSLIHIQMHNNQIILLNFRDLNGQHVLSIILIDKLRPVSQIGPCICSQKIGFFVLCLIWVYLASACGLLWVSPGRPRSVTNLDFGWGLLSLKLCLLSSQYCRLECNILKKVKSSLSGGLK